MNKFNTLLLASASTLAIALMATRAGAATTFTGNGSSSDWSDNGNWSPSTAPVNGDVILAQSGAHAPSNDDISGTYASLTLNTPTASATQASGYIVNGSGTFTFINNGIFVDNAANAAADQLNMNFVLQGATNIFVNSPSLGLNLGGVISGAGSIAAAGSRPLQLGGANTYTGGTTINSGATIIQGVGTVGTPGAITSSAFGTGTLTFNGGTLQGGGNFTVANAIAINSSGGAIDANGHAMAVSGVIANGSGIGHLTVSDSVGGGILTLSGANTYTGGTTLSSGAEVRLGVDTVGTPGAITSSAFGTGTLTFNGGTLQQGGNGFTVANAIAINSTGGTIDPSGQTINITSVIANGSGSPAGALTIDDTSGVGNVNPTGANTYTGGTHVIAGVAQLSNSTLSGGVVQSSSFGTGAITLDSNDFLTFPTAALQATANNLTLGNAIVLGSTFAPTATGGEIDTQANTMTISGNISGSGLLDKAGSGTLILSGSNSYTGPTTVTAGMLRGGVANAFGVHSAVSMADNTILDLGGFNQAIGSLTDIGSGFPFPGAAVGEVVTNSGGSLATLSIGNGDETGLYSGPIEDGTGGIALDKSGTGTQTLSGANTYSHGTTLTAGILNAGVDTVGTPGAITSSAIGTGTLHFNGGTLQAGGAFTIANAGDVQNGGGAIDSNGNSFTYSGAIASSGSGTLTIKDTNGTPGEVIFTGTNTYSGGTAILSGGTLALTGTGSIAASSGLADAGTFDISGTTTGASITSLSGAGTVTMGTKAFTITAGDPLKNFSGQINGSGPVTIAGGTQAFTSDQTYSGTTTVNSGATLKLGGGGTTGSVSGALVDNGFVSFVHSNNITLPAMSGTGGISQFGPGILTVSSAASYTGATIVSSGATLALSGSGSIAASSFLADAGTFDISAATSGASIKALIGGGGVALGSQTLTLSAAGSTSFSGIIAGSGGVILAGGSETFSGVNTYTGATTIGSGASMALGSSGSVAASSGVADAGTFDISATTSGASIKALTGAGGVTLGSKTLTISSASGTYSGVIAGTGGATLSGGSETFTGADTYTGTTTISGGATLQLGSGGTSGSVAGNIADSGTATFNRSDAVTYAGVISGAGTLNQSGSGNLILSGTSTFTGAVKINSGTLSVNGALPGAITIASGGKLGGTGTVGSVTAASGGTLAPGNSIGTLHVSGNLTLPSGSTYAVEVSPIAADETIVTGTASLGGTLALSPASGTYTAGTDYVLVSAGSVTGTFSSVTGASFGGLNSTVVYSATKVDLVLSSSAVVAPPTATFAFGTFGSTPNQVAVGTALAAGSPTGTLYTALGSLVSSNRPAVAGALAQLSGEIHASLRSAAVEDSRIIRDAVLAQVHQAGDGMNVWLKGWGATGSIAHDNNASDLNHNSSGVIGGIDVPLDEGLRVGVAGAYSERSTSVHNLAAHATGNSGHVIGYANWASEAFKLSLGGDMSWGNDHVTRQISALSETDSDHQSSRTSQVFGDAGYKIGRAGTSIEPHATIAWMDVATGAFAESGGVGALSGAAKSNSVTYSIVGLRADLDSWDFGGAALAPHLDLGWQHAFNPLTPAQVMTLISTAQSFTVTGVPLGTDSAAVQVGLGLALSPNAELSLDYDGNFSSHVEEHAVEAELKVRF